MTGNPEIDSIQVCVRAWYARSWSLSTLTSITGTLRWNKYSKHRRARHLQRICCDQPKQRMKIKRAKRVLWRGQIDKSVTKGAQKGECRVRMLGCSQLRCLNNHSRNHTCLAIPSDLLSCRDTNVRPKPCVSRKTTGCHSIQKDIQCDLEYVS